MLSNWRLDRVVHFIVLFCEALIYVLKPQCFYSSLNSFSNQVLEKKVSGPIFFKAELIN